MKALLFLSLAAFTSMGIDKKECMIVVVDSVDRIEYEDIIDIIFFDDEMDELWASLSCPVPTPEPQSEEDK